MPALRFPPAPYGSFGLVPVHRPIRAVSPYGADDALVKIPADIARALGYTSRKVPVSALHGIRVALSAMRQAAVAAGSESKARKIQGWMEQIYAMEQAQKSALTSTGRAQDGSYTPTEPTSGGSGSRPQDALVEVPAEAGTGAGLWVAAGVVAAVVAGVAYAFAPKRRQNGRRKNGARRVRRHRHNPSCCTCVR